MFLLIGIVFCFSFTVPGYSLIFHESNISFEVAGEYNFMNGTIADIAQYPYQAAIVYNISVWVLPGAIIHNKYVVTAAFFPISWEKSAVKVVVGKSKITEGARSYDVEKIIIHPKYSLGTDFSVALIKLKKPIKFSKEVKKIAISSRSPKTGTKAVTIGWHILRPNTFIDVDLSKSEIDVLNKTFCRTFYTSSAVSDTSFCGYNRDLGLQSRDCGAPLVQKKKLVGLFQGTQTAQLFCKDLSYCPYIYTDLSTVKRWIESIIKRK